MKTILVPVLWDPAQRSRVGAASAVTKAVQGYLSWLEIIDEPPRHPELSTGLGEAAMAGDCIAFDAFNRVRCEQELRHQQISHEGVSDAGPIRTATRLHALLNDLDVLSSNIGSDDDQDIFLIAGLLGQIRRAVLAVPHRCGQTDLSRAVMFAWNGSPACEAALRSPLPPLRAAREVQVISVAHASMTEVSYLVMGANGHARTCEELFGGMTHEMPHVAPMPLLSAA
jgi:hypothetical protein